MFYSSFIFGNSSRRSSHKRNTIRLISRILLIFSFNHLCLGHGIAGMIITHHYRWIYGYISMSNTKHLMHTEDGRKMCIRDSAEHIGQHFFRRKNRNDLCEMMDFNHRSTAYYVEFVNWIQVLLICNMIDCAFFDIHIFTSA